MDGMRRRSRRVERHAGVGRAALLVLMSCGVAGRAQMLQSSVQVRDVPFQAMQVVTHASETGTTVTRGRMARDAAGSTYVELVDPATGVATTAFLLDVPGRRGVVLDLVHRRYSVRPAPQLAARELSAAAVPEALQRAAETRGRSEREVRKDAEGTVTHLGTRLISGLITIGSREVWTAAVPGKAAAIRPREMESWFSVDLGLFVRMTETDSSRHESTEVGLTEILRAEPDGALFRVPDGFVPDGRSGNAVAGPPSDGE